MIRVRRERPVLWVAVALALVGAGACSDDGKEERAIPEARTWAGSTAVSASVESCNGEPEIEIINEDEEEVRLKVVAGSSGDDCLDGIVVCLAEPLGGRSLIDAKTGTRVPVERLAGEPPSDCA